MKLDCESLTLTSGSAHLSILVAKRSQILAASTIQGGDPPKETMASNDALRDVPGWNGLEESWNQYLVDVEWYFWSLPEKARALVASRLARKLSGSAQDAIRGLKPKDFAGVSGIPKLLRILQARIGEMPVPDLGNRLDTFFFTIRRKTSESMNDWGLRFQETYRQLNLALDRVRGKPADIGDYSDLKEKPISRRNYTNDSEDEEAEKFPWPNEWEQEDDEEDRSSMPIPRTWGRRGLRTTTGTGQEEGKAPSTAGSNRSKGDPLKDLKELQGPEPDSKEFLPTEVLGWLLLKGSGLSYGERATVVASTQGKLDFAGIWRALREQYPPRRTERREERKGKGKGKGKKGRKGGIHSIEEDGDYHDHEGEWNESIAWAEQDWSEQDWTGHETDWTEEEAMWTEWSGEAWTAEAGDSSNEQGELMFTSGELDLIGELMQAGKTLQQARDAISKARLSRGFYRSSGKSSGKGNKGTKGSKGFQGFKGGKSGTKGGKSNAKGPCFVCGGPHMSRDCPDRNAPRSTYYLDDHRDMWMIESFPVVPIPHPILPSNVSVVVTAPSRLDDTVEAAMEEVAEQSQEITQDNSNCPKTEDLPSLGSSIDDTAEEAVHDAPTSTEDISCRTLPVSEGLKEVEPETQTTTQEKTIEYHIEAAAPESKGKEEVEEEAVFDNTENRPGSETEGHEEERPTSQRLRLISGTDEELDDRENEAIQKEDLIVINLDFVKRPTKDMIRFLGKETETFRELLAAIRMFVMANSDKLDRGNLCVLGFRMSENVVSLDQPLSSVGMKPGSFGKCYKVLMLEGPTTSNNAERDRVVAQLPDRGNLWHEPTYPPGLAPELALSHDDDKKKKPKNEWKSDGKWTEWSGKTTWQNWHSWNYPSDDKNRYEDKPDLAEQNSGQGSNFEEIPWKKAKTDKTQEVLMKPRQKGMMKSKPVTQPPTIYEVEDEDEYDHAQQRFPDEEEEFGSGSYYSSESDLGEIHQPGAAAAQRKAAQPPPIQKPPQRSAPPKPQQQKQDAAKPLVKARTSEKDQVKQTPADDRDQRGRKDTKDKERSRDRRTKSPQDHQRGEKPHSSRASSSRDIRPNSEIRGSRTHHNSQRQRSRSRDRKDEETRICCPLCNLMTRNLARHLKEIHACSDKVIVKMLMVCEICSAEMTTAEGISSQLIIDTGATDTVASPEKWATLSEAIKLKDPSVKITIDRERGKATKFRVASGAVVSAYAHIKIEGQQCTLEGYSIEHPGNIGLLGCTWLDKRSVAIDYSTKQMCWINAKGEERCTELQQARNGHLLVDPTKIFENH